MTERNKTMLEMYKYELDKAKGLLYYYWGYEEDGKYQEYKKEVQDLKTKIQKLNQRGA